MHAELERFQNSDLQATCVKCGTAANFGVHYRTNWCSVMKQCYMVSPYKPIEHVHLICQTCSYERIMHPADYTVEPLGGPVRASFGSIPDLTGGRTPQEYVRLLRE